MAHPLLIAIALLVTMTDANPSEATHTPLASALYTLCPLLGAWVVTHLVIRRCGRVLDRTGSRRALRRAEQMARAFPFYLYVHAALAFLMFDWLAAVRATVGDLIAVDETIAAAPFLLALVAGWWSYAPIDRRLIDAALFRALDEASPVHPPPSVGQLVLDRVRHALSIGIAVVLLVLAWAETVNLIVSDLYDNGVISDPETAELLAAGAQLCVSLPVLLGAPLLIRLLWDTVPLIEGELSERIAAIARMHKVKYRRVLIWRTRGAMLNGAVVGLLAPLRYVLLTDALIERLPARQLDAVIAHEIAHVKRRHLPWLLGATAAAAAFTGVAAAILLERENQLSPLAQSISAIGASVIGAFLVFGHVSRAFERQADAFAAQTLSREAGSETITEDAASAMSGALTSVARFNHIPEHRFGFRHGSIARRKRNIRRLIGTGLKRLPVDDSVARLKIATLLAGALALVGMFTA